MATHEPAATLDDATLRGRRSALPAFPNVAACVPAAHTSDTPVRDLAASQNTPERYGEVIERSGWKVETCGHDPESETVPRYGCVRDWFGNALVTHVRLVTAHGACRNGFVQPVLVGFVPLEWGDGVATKHPHKAGKPGTFSSPSPVVFDRMPETTH